MKKKMHTDGEIWSILKQIRVTWIDVKIFKQKHMWYGCCYPCGYLIYNC